MTYNFALTDGTALTDVQPLESNGLNAQSVPRAVLDIDFGPGTNAFIVADDLTARFVAGFVFDIVSGPLQGTYIVDGAGSTYDLPTNTTTIPVTTSIVASPLSIIDVTTGLNGVWKIEGAVNGDCVYYPGAGFTVAGAGVGNGPYTVLSSEVSGAYSIFAVDSGLNKWTLAGDHTSFFDTGVQFQISANNPGFGVYTTVSAALVSGNTEIIVAEVIPGTATNLGVAQITPAITRVTVTGTIPGGSGSTGTATVPASVAYTLAAPATALTNIAPNTWTQIWHLDDLTGDVAAALVVGCPVIIKDNSVFDNFTMVVASAAVWDTVSITSVTLQYKYVTTPTLPDATGTLTFPLPPLPYGFLQYAITAADTSLELVGRGSPAYNNNITWGQSLQDNDIHLLENFNDTTPPVAPLQGQLWFNQGTSTLFLFASTVYNITAVDPGTDLWTISGNHAATFSVGLKFAVFNNTGVNLENIANPGTYPSTMVFEVLSAVDVGPDTEITITTTPSPAPPFTDVESAIPVEADDYAPYGKLYVMTDWHELAFSEDIHKLDVKASCRVATDAPLPAYTPAGSGFGKTLTANANGALTVDTVAVALNDRVLVKDEAVSHVDHGIYTVTQVGDGGNPWILTRATDADGSPGSEVSADMFTWIEEGTTNADTGWVLVTNDPIVVDATALQFSKFAIYAPGGPNTAVQYNDNGLFGGENDFTYNPATNTLTLGAVSNDAVMLGSDGSCSDPSYSFNNDTDSGVFLNPGNNVTIGWNNCGSTVEVGDIITLTADNGDFIEIGASINIIGVSATTGSPITITAGDSTTGDGGNVDITGGSTIDDDGGRVQLQGGNGGTITATANGGSISLIGGSSGTSGQSGGLSFSTSQSSGVNKTGGGISLSAGGGSDDAQAGTSTAGGGGNINLSPGSGGIGNNTAADANNALGGNAGSFNWGTGAGGNAFTSNAGATGNATGGIGSNWNITLSGGGTASITSVSGTATGGAGGSFTFTAGQAGAANGGASQVTGPAGTLSLIGGSGASGATNTSIGGAITLTGGSGGSTVGDGGSVTLQGGGVTSGDEGDVIIGTGATTTTRDGNMMYIPTAAGVPTGTPVGASGRVAMLWDTTNDDLYVYDAGWILATGGGGVSEPANQIVFGTGAGVDSSSGFTFNGGTGELIYDPDFAGLTGGGVTFLCSDGPAATSTGQGFNVTTGDGNTTGDGGNLSLTTGAGGATGDGGTVSLAGGAGGATSGAGGSVVVTAGSATTGSAPGRIGHVTQGGYEYQRSGNFSVAGDAQSNMYVLRTVTTAVETQEMFLDGAGGTQRMVVPNDSTWLFNIRIVARNIDTDGQSAAYQFDGTIDNNAGTTALVGSLIQTIVAEDQAGWFVDVTADDANDALTIDVTSDTTDDIRWVAFVRTVEVSG